MRLLSVYSHNDLIFQKGPVVGRFNKAVAIIFNALSLYVVLTLCFFIWFSRLYNSWACINGQSDILTLCQLTNQIQCYQCRGFDSGNCSYDALAECVQESAASVYHCLSPLYTIDNPKVSVQHSSLTKSLFIPPFSLQHTLVGILCL